MAWQQLFISCLISRYSKNATTSEDHNCLFQVSSAKARWPGLADAYNTLESDLAHMVEWLLLPRSVLTTQEQFDAHQESHRLRLLSYLLHCRHTISTDNIQVSFSICSYIKLFGFVPDYEKFSFVCETEYSAAISIFWQLWNHAKASGAVVLHPLPSFNKACCLHISKFLH